MKIRNISAELTNFWREVKLGIFLEGDYGVQNEIEQKDMMTYFI